MSKVPCTFRSLNEKFFETISTHVTEKYKCIWHYNDLLVNGKRPDCDNKKINQLDWKISK